MLRNRYRRIIAFFARIIFSFVFWDMLLPRLGLRGLARRTRSARLRRSAIRYRALAIQMGGVLIKVGQFLSARLDMLPDIVTSELAGLQDEVPAEPFEPVRRVVETELARPVSLLFERLEASPLAAASLGQVHRARLRADAAAAEVVVKVQRSNVEQLIATDLAALRTVSSWLKRYPPIRRRADVPALLAEFTRTLYEEIDYLAEGRNAETFAANFKGDARVRVPRVYWTHTARRVLTLEDVYAIKITDYAAITAAGIDRAAVAQRLFQTYLKQIFEHGFFHADPHPGNLFVQPCPAEPRPEAGAQAEAPSATEPVERNWQLVFVDFGMVGRVPPNSRAALREVIIGIATRDAGRVIRAYQQMGLLLPHADLAELERAEARMFERFWGKDMAELRNISPQDMRAFVSEFRSLLYSLPFQVPEDMILLGRTIAILSGMCTGLNPQFNVWTSLVPYAQQVLEAEAAGGWRFWLGEAGDWLRTVVALPHQIDAALGRLERGEVLVSDPVLARQVARLGGALDRLAGFVLAGAALLAGVQLYAGGKTIGAGLLWAGAGLVALWVIFRADR